MSTKIYGGSPDREDFFTKLSFSALMVELGDKENIMMDNLQLQVRANRNVVRFEKEIGRWIGSKTDQELISFILMWVALIYATILSYRSFPG